MLKRTILFIFIFLLFSCATYQNHVREARLDLENGRPKIASEKLKEKALKPSDDQLVYLFDYALSLQQAGQYKESNKAFLLADQLSEEKDYASLSRIGGSLLLNEGMMQYKGEDYEKVLINAYLAINYLMLKDYEGALVEARRLNQKLYRYKYEAKKDYEQNVFAKYLTAMIWENDEKWDDAYIEYESCYELDPSLEYLKEDLIRSAYLAQRTQALEKWKKAFPEIKINPQWKSKTEGEIVLIYQQGWAPRKHPRPENFRFPILRHEPSYTRWARLIVTPKGQTQSSLPMVETSRVYDVERIAIKTLDDAYAALVAKRIGGVVAKYAVAEEVGKNNRLLGDLMWIFLNVSDQADLRQWSTLPESFQVARLRLPAGQYEVKIEGLSGGNLSSAEASMSQSIDVVPRKKSFLNWRSFR